ncbi:Ras-related protein RABC2a [Apostasia shenzhenica]|uniref:Ras-related protein RABC2a n=1 Tax=Apostasia shenzhenica TaxID=1088818 RepID=A0A2H9ZQT2_9ASPA|nr:Ras-related protein RABC2a [Apostasia shenzhenica]
MGSDSGGSKTGGLNISARQSVPDSGESRQVGLITYKRVSISPPEFAGGQPSPSRSLFSQNKSKKFRREDRRTKPISRETERFRATARNRIDNPSDLDGRRRPAATRRRNPIGPETMSKLGRALVRPHLPWVSVAFLRRLLRLLWRHVIACSCSPAATAAESVPDGDYPFRYRRLSRGFSQDEDVESTAAPPMAPPTPPPPLRTDAEDDPDDLVSLKVSLLGDRRIGKTSFMVKYVGKGEENQGLQLTGLNLMDKVFFVRGARIAFSIWDVGGDGQFLDHIPLACKDAVAILIMFDLTNRSTLNNAIDWYMRGKKWNKTAIPILIGTKFDDFVQLPLHMQWAIVNEARAYARVMKATLFFSSASHNINVNKIFKFITAKIFNLPWTVERNLTVGEPIIDF